jgi:hypothetical protein
VILDVEPGGNVEFMTRSAAGDSTSWLAGASRSIPVWLKLVRSGTTVTGYVSADGSAWTGVGSTAATLGKSVYVGLAVTSHDSSVLNTSAFDNVVVTAGGT